MAKTFTEKQKEIMARKLGYDGPMTEFEKFVKSDPAMERKYNAVVGKLMARKGAYVTKMAVGGTTQPAKPATPTVTAEQIKEEPGQVVTTAGAPATATTVAPTAAPAAVTVAPEAAKPAETITAAAAAPAVATTLKDVEAAQGTVSPGAQVTAAQAAPMDTAVAKVEAAQGTTRQVEGAPVRKLEAGEVIEGPAVDREAVDKAIEETKASAAQGEVTEDMTVQGQLSRLVTDFEAGNPPSWAAASLRNVTSQLAQRGLGASSLAGQALIQATLEAAIPIAAQDAQVYRDMGIQNLNNRQQTAVLAAQQRAQFLGQEFDQAFQSRVINAATISNIANVNFEAKQQIALENARLAQTMDLANLNNRQAMVLATASQIATLETANLNNRQQAAVANAQAFLQMDLTNLSNRQQTTLFKSQEMINSIMSDNAAENAARQFNASSINQVNQFYDSLATQVKQFNATQTNAMSQFNTEQANAVAQFNASVQNQRDQFNAESRRIIDQSNAEWRRNIATANTAATNRANEVNANAALELTTTEYNNLWQKHRDDIEYAWKTGENVLDRENQLAMQVLQKQATIEAAEFQVEAAKYEALGALGATVLQDASVMKSIGGTVNDLFNVLRAATGAGSKETLEYTGTFISAVTGKETTWDPVLSPTGGGMWDNGWQYFTDPDGNNVTISDTGDYFLNGSIVWSPDQGRYID
jgi:hypothetical protein